MPISWLNHKPHAIAVYASWPALPSAHATLATGCLARASRTGLSPAGLHQLWLAPSPYRTLPLHISDDLRHRILRRYRYQHMNMIGHQVALLDPALLPSRQIVKYLAQVPLDLPEQQFLAVLRRKHDVVLAVPSRVIKMIVLCFHHGLLEDSWRFPKETP